MSMRDNVDFALSKNKEYGTLALVIGGSIAGLLAACVLSKYYDHVLLVERDSFPQKPERRAGTPQAFHGHRLLLRGKLILERLFPGFLDELLKNGAFSMQGKNIRVITPYGGINFCVPEPDASWSRALLEWILRQRVLTLPNVCFLTRQEVISFQATPDRTRIIGVQIREHGQTEQATTVTTDLVVDASGYTSKLPQWLQALGYEQPPAEHVTTSLGYSTAYYQTPSALAQKEGMIFTETRSGALTKVASLIPIENNIYQALLFSAGGYYPPTTPKDFADGFDQLMSPMIGDALREVEMLIPPRGFRMPECVRHHYEQMERWPSGLLVLGDALCYFDPIYGQGMSVAAIEAEILDTCLHEQQGHIWQPDFELRTLQRLQAAIEPAWWLSTVADLRWPGVKYSGPLKGFAFAQKYLDLYLKRALQPCNGKRQDDSLIQKYVMMTSLMISPREIFNARMITTLLTADASDESKQLFAEFSPYSLRFETLLEQMLDEIVPAFSLAFETHTPTTLSQASQHLP